jgi:non-heme chloroperoxidase
MGAGEIIRYLSSNDGIARVSRIVRIAPAGAPYPLKSDDNPDGIDACVLEGFRKNFLLKDYPKWLAEKARPFVVEDNSEEMVNWIIQMMLQTSMKALAEFNRSGFSQGAAWNFRAHTHYPWRQDVSAPIDRTGRKTTSMIPGAKLKVYEGAPHGLFVTHMDRLNSDLAGFAAD